MLRRFTRGQIDEAMLLDRQQLSNACLELRELLADMVREDLTEEDYDMLMSALTLYRQWIDKEVEVRFLEPEVEAEVER